MGNTSKLHYWSLCMAIAYCSTGAFLSLKYWTNLGKEALPAITNIFLPSKLITVDSIYGNGSITFAFLWHLILLLLSWAFFYLIFKMFRILWEMR